MSTVRLLLRALAAVLPMVLGLLLVIGFVLVVLQAAGLAEVEGRLR